MLQLFSEHAKAHFSQEKGGGGRKRKMLQGEAAVDTVGVHEKGNAGKREDWQRSEVLMSCRVLFCCFAAFPEQTELQNRPAMNSESKTNDFKTHLYPNQSMTVSYVHLFCYKTAMSQDVPCLPKPFKSSVLGSFSHE